ncbi:hypothetical protein WJX84_011244 [Apatococcus fuscideae]|uniref:Membrane-associated protein n=1 Tax=Apatococcus fuscideae TaxID=2026836 RepID=A0AAW1T9P7_9CHLO
MVAIGRCGPGQQAACIFSTETGISLLVTDILEAWTMGSSGSSVPASQQEDAWPSRHASCFDPTTGSAVATLWLQQFSRMPVWTCFLPILCLTVVGCSSQAANLTFNNAADDSVNASATVAAALPDAGLLVRGSTSTLPVMPPQPARMPPFALDLPVPLKPHTSAATTTQHILMPSPTCAVPWDRGLFVERCALSVAFAVATMGAWLVVELYALLYLPLKFQTAAKSVAPSSRQEAS